MQEYRILIYGAGVIGSFYASRLLAKHDVTLLARGRRLNNLKENGLVLVNEDTGAEERHAVKVIDRLDPEDRYDFILVTMRCQQALEILPILKANISPAAAFLMNGVTSYDAWHDALGSRMLSAFPVLGGELRGGTVHYALGLEKGGMKPTYMGAPADGDSQTLAALAQAFEGCGLPVKTIGPMRDFHFMHVALVSPIANALYRCNGSNYELAENPEVLREMFLAMREGFRALRRKGIKTVPGSLRLFDCLPLWLAVPVAARMFKTPHFETVAARHARNARDEMARLYRELLDFFGDSGIELKSTRELGRYIDLQ